MPQKKAVKKVTGDGFNRNYHNRWEYLNVHSVDRNDNDAVTQMLDEHGSQGWELMIIQNYQDPLRYWQTRFIFKRRKAP